MLQIKNKTPQGEIVTLKIHHLPKILRTYTKASNLSHFLSTFLYSLYFVLVDTGVLFAWGLGRACGYRRQDVLQPVRMMTRQSNVVMASGGCAHSVALTGKSIVFDTPLSRRRVVAILTGKDRSHEGAVVSLWFFSEPDNFTTFPHSCEIFFCRLFRKLKQKPLSYNSLSSLCEHCIVLSIMASNLYLKGSFLMFTRNK